MTTNSESASLTAAREPSAPIAVDLRRVPGIRSLAADYVDRFTSLAPFFAGDPHDPAAWQDTIRRTQSHERRRSDIAAIVAHQQERRQAPAVARAAARTLADPAAVAIITGQQAGLFGGPLYTLLKALTAIKLAARITAEHGVPVVPIFWIEAEDHDWDEVRSCTVLDSTPAPQAVALPERKTAEQLPVANICLDPSVDAVISQLEQILPETEFRSTLIARLRRAYTPNVGMSEAFGRWLEAVLGDRGLVVFDASDPSAKALVRDLFVRELSAPGDTARLAAAAGAELQARGYHAQVQASSGDAVALFHLDGERRPIRHESGRFIVGGTEHPASALVQLASERPTAFSPNVLLRPIVQDTLFPTICYVAGPNELAYLAQLRGVYDHFSVPMPLMYPRQTATLVDSAALRFLQKYQLPLDAFQAQDESALNQLLAAQIPPSIEEAFSSAGRALDERMAALIAAMPALDPTLEGAAKSTLGRMQHDLDTLRGKMIQAAKRRDDTLRRQFLRTRALVFPGGHAQERTVGFVWFLNQYGDALLDRLDDLLPLDMGHHWIAAI